MPLEVAHTEYTGGGPGYALVRLTGAARSDVACRLAPPTLLIADGPAWRRLATVPGTPLLRGTPDGAAFAVAFEVPLHLALGDGAWWLEPGPAVAAAAGAPWLEPEPAVAPIATRGGGRWLEPGPAVAADPARGDGARLDVLAGRVAALRGELEALRARVEEHAAPTPDAVPVPRRSRLRALRPGLPALLVAAGALAVGDAVSTVAWQEPVSALWAAHEQHALQGDLARLDSAYDTPGAADAGAAAPAATANPVLDAQARIRALAHTLESGTTSGNPLGELRIPRLDARLVIVQGTGSGSLRRGPGHYYGTALPGQPGTVGIAGHRTTYGAPFRHLDALRRGDPITITMPYGRFVYRVEGTRIVKPEDVSTLRAIGRQRLVLTACHPLYSAAQRLVVIADLERSVPRGAAAAATGPSRPGGADAA